MFPFIGLVRRPVSSGGDVLSSGNVVLPGVQVAGMSIIEHITEGGIQIPVITVQGLMTLEKLSVANIVMPAMNAGGQMKLEHVAQGGPILRPMAVTGSMTITANPTPSIYINSPTSAALYDQSGQASATETEYIAGSAFGNGGTIQNVTYTVTGATNLSGTAIGTSNWYFQPVFNFGAHTVTVRVTNVGGKTATATFTFHRHAMIAMARNGVGMNRTISVSGYCYGASGNPTYELKNGGGSVYASGYCNFGFGSVADCWGSISYPGYYCWSCPWMTYGVGASYWYIYITVPDAAGGKTTMIYSMQSMN